jgi:FkbM family methyltransferase
MGFYRSLLVGFRKGDLIFDIGANNGFKTDIFLRLGARVVAVEPDKSNQIVLADKFLKYRMIKKPVSIVAKAVSNKTGRETLWINEPGSAKNTLNLGRGIASQ